MNNAPKRGLILALISTLVLSGLALFAIKKAESSREAIPVIIDLPPFQFVQQDGKPFGLQQLKGKITVADFMFTSCKGACPMMSAKMAELYKTYAESDKVQFVSISVDPKNDSLAVLQDYAKKFGVTDSRWSFLHAPLDSVQQLSEKGFLLSGELPGMHSTKFVLIDDQARVRGYFNYEDGMSIKVLKTQIRQLALKN